VPFVPASFDSPRSFSSWTATTLSSERLPGPRGHCSSGASRHHGHRRLLVRPTAWTHRTRFARASREQACKSLTSRRSSHRRQGWQHHHHWLLARCRHRHLRRDVSATRPAHLRGSVPLARVGAPDHRRPAASSADASVRDRRRPQRLERRQRTKPLWTTWVAAPIARLTHRGVPSRRRRCGCRGRCRRLGSLWAISLRAPAAR